MRCFHPLNAYRTPVGVITFTSSDPRDRELQLPCGQCVGCRLRRSAEWATRCIHEAKLHPFNTWVTLTYDDTHLPKRYYTGHTHPRTKKPIYAGSLDKTHIQKFIRATRKALGRKANANGPILFQYYAPETPEPSDANMGATAAQVRGIRPLLRYYYGGEYGEQYGRPHYHACLFGIEFQDRKHVETTDAGFKLYESERLYQLWPNGRHTIGDLTWETAAYTARYIMKKINGQKQKQHYTKTDQETGEIITLQPEFNDMSRRPGIANQWYEKYKTDVYKNTESYVIQRGQKTKPPRYYDKLHERDFPDAALQVKFQRQLEAIIHAERHTPQRLKAEEQIQNQRIQTLKQKL